MQNLRSAERANISRNRRPNDKRGHFGRGQWQAGPPSLCRLDEDALDDIDNILAAVSDDLQSFVNLLPLENFDGVGSLLEQSYKAIAEKRIGHILEAIHL